MEFNSPWWLTGLPAVGAVALWALFRPGRQLAIVGSLELWQKAASALDRSARRSSRKITLSWLTLLLGSTAAVLALAQPVLHTSAPARRVALELYPSADLAGSGGMDELRKSADTLLDRLNPQDRVRVVLPPILGGPGDWLTPAQAKLLVLRTEPLPIPAAGIGPYPAAPDVQHTYRFGSRNLPASPGPGVSELRFAPRPGVAISAIGAKDISPGRVQLLVTVIARADLPADANLPISLELCGFDAAGKEAWRESAKALPGRPLIRECPQAAAIWVSAKGKLLAEAGSQAGLVRTSVQRKKVYLLGADEPRLRQYVKADPLLEVTADANAADVILANRADLPAGRAGVAIAPPTPPEGWQRLEVAGPIMLADAGTAADDAVMRDVNLRGIAVRRASPWKALDSLAGVALASWKGGVMVVRNDPAAAVGQDRPPRRVYLAFDISGENTNFSSSEPFVIFLANAVRWITADVSSGHASGRDESTAARGTQAATAASAEYAYLTPPQARFAEQGSVKHDWKQLAGVATAGPMPWPGLYKDFAGALHAVNLLGVDNPEQPPAPPETAKAESVTLPPAEPSGQTREFWPWLTVLSLLLCLAGWTLRVR